MRLLIIGGVLAVAAVGAAVVAWKVFAPTAPKAALPEGRDPGEILKVGDEAPPFEVKDDDGNLVRLADFKGDHPVVLIFYPGNNTPTCTAQLCTARDDFSKYEALDAAVFGVNPASAESHDSFSDKYNFPFPLLADTDGMLINGYGCRGIGGVTKRTVYVIDREGRIAFAERGVPSTEDIVASISG